MLELILFLVIAFFGGASSWGFYVYFSMKLGEKRCRVYTLLNDKNEFLGYETVDGNGAISKFMGEQKLVEPLLLDFLKNKKFVEDKR